MPSGLFFQLSSIGDTSKRVYPGDYLQLKYQFHDSKNAQLGSDRLLVKINDTTLKGGLTETISLLNEGESGRSIFPLGLLKKEFNGMFQIGGRSDSALVYCTIELDRIIRSQDFEAEKSAFIAWVNQIDSTNYDVLRENQILDEFEQENGLRTQKTPTGLRYFFIRKNKGEQVDYGKHVALSYEGQFTDGKLFNSTQALKDGVQEFYYGQEMQVIKGLEEGLLKMGEGDVMVLLIPSWIGFGEEGSSNGLVPAHTPVVYQIELKSVN